MDKTRFLDELRDRLSGLPESDLQERVLFYSEMIDDRVEDGLTEEAAVAEIGSVDEIVEQIMCGTPLASLVKEKVRRNRNLRTWEILLLVLGSPVWLPLTAAAFAVGLALCAVMWAVLICFWAADFSLAVCSAGGLAMAVWYLLRGSAAAAGLMLGAALVCAGLAILLYFGCLALTKGLARLMKKTLLWIKTLFAGGRNTK